jgi:hypothetical protein
MKKSKFLTVYHAEDLKPQQASIPLNEMLPEFSATNEAPLIIRNALHCAINYRFSKPYTLLISGQGYLVIDGDALYYYPLSWPGENRAWVLQDIHYLLSIVEQRMVNFNLGSLGRWAGIFIEGTNHDLVILATNCAYKKQLILKQSSSALNYPLTF